MAKRDWQVLWTDRAMAKLAEHSLTPEEVEPVIHEPIRPTSSRSNGLPLVFGLTPTDRFIAVVFEQEPAVKEIYPVTGYPVGE